MMSEWLPYKPPVHDKGWGVERWVVNSPLYCGKVLEVEQGKKCSWHYHLNKHEHFFLETGRVRLRYGWDKDISKATEVILSPGDAFEVPPGLLHQFEAVDDSRLFEFSTEHFDGDSFRVIHGD